MSSGRFPVKDNLQEFAKRCQVLEKELFEGAWEVMARPERFELEPFCGRLSPQAKS
jgi:hypothetical protein